jgi:hypothetical protein
MIASRTLPRICGAIPRRAELLQHRRSLPVRVRDDDADETSTDGRESQNIRSPTAPAAHRGQRVPAASVRRSEQRVAAGANRGERAGRRWDVRCRRGRPLAAPQQLGRTDPASPAGNADGQGRGKRGGLPIGGRAAVHGGQRRRSRLSGRGRRMPAHQGVAAADEIRATGGELRAAPAGQQKAARAGLDPHRRTTGEGHSGGPRPECDGQRTPVPADVVDHESADREVRLGSSASPAELRRSPG